MSTQLIIPATDVTAQGMLAALDHVAAETAKQTLLLEHIAGTTIGGAAVEDWGEVAEIVSEGMAPAIFPAATTRLNIPWEDKASSSSDAVAYDDNPWNVVHYGTGALSDGETIPVMLLQMHYCLPFDAQFSPVQAFLYAIDGLPAGTYNVTVPSEMSGRAAGTYQFTLTQALPAKGQLTGFFAGGSAAAVKAWASQTATDATETCAVTSGNDGTSLGTWSAAGDQAVPASGTPATSKTITIDGTDYHVYGLNSVQRVIYGNNRWLHSPLRQWLNKSGFDWWVPATVFDRKPAYAARRGFLSGLPEEFLERVQPIARKTALNYITDGGTSAAPEYDTTYDLFALPSGIEHFLQDTATYGGAQGKEGEPWEYWKRASGASTARGWGGTYPALIQYDLASKATARTVWMRSANRGNGNNVAYVNSSGKATSSTAYYGYRAAPACAIG